MSVYRCLPVEGPLDAALLLPGSKSITNRALIAAALAAGKSQLSGLLLAEDTRIMLAALERLGISVSVDEQGARAVVQGCGGVLPSTAAELFCGNSGTTMRFCTALVALGNGIFKLDGRSRMRERPIGGLIEPLRTLGARIESLAVEGYPPLEIRACGLRGGAVSLHSPESSQFLSGLMLVAPYAASDLIVEVTGELPSRPYIAMTAALMRRFGVSVTEESGASALRLRIKAPSRYSGTELQIEPDASNASYFLAAPAIVGGRVTVERLGTDSIQGDARFVDQLEKMGCRIGREADRLSVFGPPEGSRLRGIDVDLNDMPDTVMTLAVVALYAEGPTSIHNVGNLRIKETDRLAALARELSKLGATVEEEESGLTIHPPAKIRPGGIDTYDDHRMAMSFSLAGLRSPGISINNPECCSKTFPDFFECFERMTGVG